MAARAARHGHGTDPEGSGRRQRVGHRTPCCAMLLRCAVLCRPPILLCYAVLRCAQVARHFCVLKPVTAFATTPEEGCTYTRIYAYTSVYVYAYMPMCKGKRR